MAILTTRTKGMSTTTPPTTPPPNPTSPSPSPTPPPSPPAPTGAIVGGVVGGIGKLAHRTVPAAPSWTQADHLHQPLALCLVTCFTFSNAAGSPRVRAPSRNSPQKHKAAATTRRRILNPAGPSPSRRIPAPARIRLRRRPSTSKALGERVGRRRRHRHRFILPAI